jgi:plasmid segregation protein ParM
MPYVVRAIDVGFGQTKYVSALGDAAIECAHFPSVAIPSLVDTSRSTVLGGRRRTVAVPVGPMFYEVGHDIDFVGAHARPALSIEGYATSPEHQALLRGALHFMNVDHVDLLVLGLPVAVFAQRKAHLEKLATGEHQVGKGRTVTVSRALAVAQPQGALVTYAVQHGALEAIRQQESLIIDAGSRTFDWLCARGLRLVANRSHSAPYGVYDVTSRIAEAITAEIGETYDDRDAIDLALRKLKALSLFGKPLPVERYRPVVESIAQEAVRAMSLSIGGKYRFDNIVLVGGGAHLFKRALKEAFPRQRLQEVAEPIYANVRGFQRAGMDKLGVPQPASSEHPQEKADAPEQSQPS